MTASSYRLDTVSANLIEHLEGARRTWLGQPDAAREGFRRIAEETVGKVLAEYQELFGDSDWGHTLRREILDTFLPRYERLALDHNDLEDQGYHSWRGGDPIARIVATLATLAVALAAERVLHHPVTLLGFLFVVLVPFAPELRGVYYRRRYRKLLQEVVNDMGRIQDELERYAAVEVEPSPSVEQHKKKQKPPQMERA